MTDAFSPTVDGSRINGTISLQGIYGNPYPEEQYFGIIRRRMGSHPLVGRRNTLKLVRGFYRNLEYRIKYHYANHLLVLCLL